MPTLKLENVIINLILGAAALTVAAGVALDLPRFIMSFTPPLAGERAANEMASQLRWSAGVTAVFFLLRGFGVFRSRPAKVILAGLHRGAAAHWLVSIFAMAFGVRVLYALVFAAPPPISDEGCYDGLAWNLARGEGYAAGGLLTAYWPVGLPAVMAFFYFIFGHTFTPVVIFQAALGAVAAVLTTLVAERFTTPAASRGAGLAVAICPSQVAYAARLFPATLAGFLVLVAAYIIIRYAGYGGAALAGFVTGLAAYVLPTVISLPSAVFFYDLFLGRRVVVSLGRTVITAAVMAAAVAPWTYRNWRALSAFVPVSTNSGVNFWSGNNPHATGTYYYPTSRTNPLYMTAGEVERDRLGIALGWYFIRHEPRTFLMLTVPKFIYLYGSDISAFQVEALRDGVPSYVSARSFRARMAQTFYTLIVIAFVAALIKKRRAIFHRAAGVQNPIAGLLIWPAVLTFVYLWFVGEDRFHYPMLPFIIAVGAMAWDNLVGEPSAHERE